MGKIVKLYDHRGRIIDQNPYTQTANASLFGGLQSGGLFNSISGAGTGLDKSEGFFFSPTRVINRQEFETIRAESWAAKSFIDIPVDDMFVYRREFEGLDDDVKAEYNDYMDSFRLYSKFARAMKAGRLYGTGLLIYITKEAPLDTPLNPKRLRPGDLSNILVVDRFDCSVLGRNNDPFSTNYGRAETYLVNLKRGGSFVVHHSRVERFDGQESLSDDGWTTYDEDWGVSEIIPALTSIYQEEGNFKAASHLLQEYSIPVQKVKDFKEIVATGVDEDTGLTLPNLAETMSLLKGIYRTKYMDADDDFDRVEVNLGGVPELLDRNAKRLGAIAKVPMTRFLGTPAVGLNATGEGDAANYALQVNSDQENDLRPALRRADIILTRTCGIRALRNTGAALDYKFPSLMEVSDESAATTAFTKVQAVAMAISSGIIDEDKGAEILDGDRVFGTVEAAPGLPEFRQPAAPAGEQAREGIAATERPPEEAGEEVTGAEDPDTNTAEA